MRNSKYKEDADYVVRVGRILLTPVGILPRLGNETFFSRFCNKLYNFFIFGLMMYLLVPHFIWIWFDAEDLKKLMKIIAAQVFNSLAILKFWTLIIKKRDIRYCLEEMEDNYKNVDKEEDRQIMIANAKIGRFFTTAYLSLSYGGALPYHIVMPLVADRVPKVSDNNTLMIPLPYPSDYIFFIPENWPLYQITFVTQIMISTLMLSTNTGVYSLIASCVMHSCSLFDVVAYKMECLKNEENQHTLLLKLKQTIKLHIKAIEFANKMEGALNVVFLCEMLGCTVIICFLEFGILIDWEDQRLLGTMTYAVLMTSIFVNVFIISFIGDRMKELSLKVGDSIYDIHWHHLSKKMSVILQFVIARSNKPTVLTGGKIFDLSLQGFTEVVKTSAAYLNFLRALEIT